MVSDTVIPYDSTWSSLIIRHCICRSKTHSNRLQLARNYPAFELSHTGSCGQMKGTGEQTKLQNHKPTKLLGSDAGDWHWSILIQPYAGTPPEGVSTQVLGFMTTWSNTSLGELSLSLRAVGSRAVRNSGSIMNRQPPCLRSMTSYGKLLVVHEWSSIVEHCGKTNAIHPTSSN